MTVACCDPTQLPQASLGAKRQLMLPNPITIPARSTTFCVEISHPAVVKPNSAPSATLYASPSRPISSTNLTDYYSSSGALFLNAPGKWFIYYDTTTVLEAVVLDAHSDGAMLALGAAQVAIAGGTSGLTADVGNTDADADFVTTNNALSVRANTAIFDADSGLWHRTPAATVANRTGDLASVVRGQDVLAQTFGRDTSGTAVVAAVEARSVANMGNAATSLIGLMGNSVGHIIDTSAGNLKTVAGLPEISAQNTAAAAAVQMREAGYLGGLKSRRFTLVLPANTIAQTGSSFSATAPVILWTNAASNEGIVRKVRVQWYDAITVATTRVRFCVDPDNRYSSGGVSAIPTGGFKSTNRDSSAGAAYTPTQFRYNDGITAIVATAADDDEYFYGDLTALDGESESVWEPKDDTIVPASGTLMMYGWDGGGTDFTIMIEVEIANVQ